MGKAYFFYLYDFSAANVTFILVTNINLAIKNFSMLDPDLGGEFFADPCGPESETLGATRSLFYFLHIFWDRMVGNGYA